MTFYEDICCCCYLGHQKYFKKMAEEENEHANKFMEYQNKRGGTIVLLDIKVCELFDV
jgi:ferritin heavy chain